MTVDMNVPEFFVEIPGLNEVDIAPPDTDVVASSPVPVTVQVEVPDGEQVVVPIGGPPGVAGPAGSVNDYDNIPDLSLIFENGLI